MKKKKTILIMLLVSLIIILTSCIPEKVYNLNITTDGNGSYSVEPEKDSYKIGESVKITAIPNDNYMFSHWSGDVENTDNPLNIEITKDTNIKANYVLKEYNLKITTDGNGSYSVEPEKDSYKIGESVTVTAVPNEKYSFSHWSGAVDSINNPLNITITKDINIKANFGSIQWENITKQVIANEETLTIDLTKYSTISNNKTLTYELISGPGNITDATYFYTPENENGLKEVKILAKSNDGYFSHTSFNIYVNVVPKWEKIPEQKVYINEAFNLDLSKYVTDTNDDSLDYVLLSTHGSIKDNIYSFYARTKDKFEIKIRVFDKYDYYSDASFTIDVLFKPWTIWAFNTGYTIYSSPAIGNDGTIYVSSGSWDGKLYAINPDGTKKWDFETEYSVHTPAIGSDGTIYVGSGDNRLYAINPDGTQKWAFNTGYMIYSSPAIGSDGTIYVGSNNKLYAINLDGTKKWSFTTGDYINSSPTIGNNGTIYVGSDNGNLYAINPDGTEKWSFATESIIWSSPAIGEDGTIYVGSNNKLYAINPDGTQKWAFTTDFSINSSPAIGSDGTIYVGSWGNNLYAINTDGTKKWSFETLLGEVDSSPVIGSDGTIYVGAGRSLYEINPDGTVKITFNIGSDISSPAIGSDGTVYVGAEDNRLYAIEGNSGGLADTPWPKFGKNNRNTGNFNDSE